MGRRLALLLGAALASSCGCGNTRNEQDAGDASALDADADAQLDGGAEEGGRDTGSTDAALDTDTGWARLPDVPTGCLVERASRPDDWFAPTWVPCEHAPGCMRLEDEAGYQRAYSEQGGETDNERGYFVAVQAQLSDARRRRMVVIASSEGAPVAVLRGPNPLDVRLCIVGPESTGPVASFVVATNDGARQQERIYTSPIGSLSAVNEATVVLDESILGSSSITHVFATDTTIAAEIQPAGFVVLIERGEALRLPPTPTPYDGVPQNIQLVGGHALWESWGDGVSIVHASYRDDPAVYLTRRDSGCDIRSLQATADDITWLEACDRQADGTYLSIDLWASPYARVPEDLAPRRIARMSSVVDGQLGAHIFAYEDRYAPPRVDEPFSDMVFIDLRDNRVRRFPLPPGVAAAGPPLYVTETESMVAIRDRGTRLLRVDLSALTPQPLPAL